ncbi:MAG: glycosyltransferase family 4 protein [Kiritimatiellia bacterium]
MTDIHQINHLPRVCLLINTFHPVVGGGERHALLLGRALAKSGAAVTVITGHRTRGLPRRETIEGMLVLRAGPLTGARWGKYLMIPAAIAQIYRRRQEFDVIYVCGLRVLGLPGAWAARLSRRPCLLRAEARGELSGDFIWNSVGNSRRPLLETILRPLIRLRNRMLIRLATGWISISSIVREEYLAHNVPSERIHDISNGIEPMEFTPADAQNRRQLRAELQLPPEAAICAYTGKLNRGKGLPFLLRLWPELLQKQPTLHLLLIGGGGGQSLSCEQELRQYIAEHGLEPHVTITGYTGRVADYLRTANLFVFPSRSETLGLAPLEAMACELPVVASRIPGLTDIVTDRHNGLLADPESAREWMTAITQLLEAPEEARRLGVNARRDVLRKFSIEADARSHLELFMRLRQ